MLRMIVLARPATVALALAVALTTLGPAAPAATNRPVSVRTTEVVKPVSGSTDFELAAGTSHIAIHWTGHQDARLTARFSPDGSTFGEPQEVSLDEMGLARGDGQTYGSVMVVEGGARTVRVSADEPLDEVTVVAMDAGADVPATPPARVSALTNIPTIIPRSGWGADETIRFDRVGDERWGRDYFPIQKMTVHHTAGSNYDPNPAATVRAVYYYQAVTQDWGDIGYNYLIDSAGRIYEGRYSRDYWNGAIPTADDGAGQMIAGGHALQHNSGNMGVALLGTFDTVRPTSAAVAGLVRLLAWTSSTYGIDPRGSSTYVNPVTGLTRYTPNIAGHRNYNSTACPGTALYNLLPTIRSQVYAAMNTWPGELFNPPRRVLFSATTLTGRQFSASGTITASKSYTLSAMSTAPTSQAATIPNQAGTWYYITAGAWAGYWIQASGQAVLQAPVAPPGVEAYWPTRPLQLAAGTYVGRKFTSTGGIYASRTGTLAAASSTWTTQKVQIPGQGGGWWYYVTAGLWDGYWLPEGAGTTLGPPPPTWTMISGWNPAVTLHIAKGTYVGYVFNAYGAVASTRSGTLASASGAPTTRYGPVPNQTGNWYYITSGLWGGMWIRESAGTTLDP